jgi:dipeptidyl aminopeptidase/acylaminoacyl peptidase
MRAVTSFAIALLALAAIGPQAPSAPAHELISRKTIFGNPERASPLLSPDGGKIAFLAPLNGVMNVWVAPKGDLAVAKPITAEKSRPVRWFRWAPAGGHLLYQQDRAGDENFQVFAVDLAKGQTRNLTPQDGVRAMLIAASYRRPSELLIGLNNRDPKWHDVWRVDLITGKSVLVEKNLGMADYLAGNDLELRLAVKSTPDGGSVVLKKSGAQWRPFIEVPPDDNLTSYPVSISDTGKVTMIDSRARDKAALATVDLATGVHSVIGENGKADVAHKILDPVTSVPLAFAAEYERLTWTAIDPALKPDIDALAKAVPGEWTLLSQSKDNRFWTLRIDNVVESVKFALYDRTSKKLSTLFVARPALQGTALAKMHPVVIKARDGLELVSYLTLPKHADKDGDGRPETPVPLVLNVHGGPWDRSGFGYDPEHQWLADRGYGVLSVNFRGSTGFGKAFVNAADRQWAGKMHDDLLDAVDWAVKSRIAPADKIAIYGGSYGGYAALVGVSFTPKTFACGVSIVGPSNLNTLLASIPPYWESLLDTFKRRVGDPTTPEGRNLLTERSPLFRAGQIERPLLIAQGANDPRVKQGESDQIVQAMKAKNIPVTYLLFADEGHGFARPENRMAFYAVAEAFLAKCLGGKVQPIGADFMGSSISVVEGREFVPGLSEALGVSKPR